MYLCRPPHNRAKAGPHNSLIAPIGVLVPQGMVALIYTRQAMKARRNGAGPGLGRDGALPLGLVHVAEYRAKKRYSGYWFANSSRRCAASEEPNCLAFLYQVRARAASDLIPRKASCPSIIGS
jgi:hypothetical protein